jgi:GxxExxY protein
MGHSDPVPAEVEACATAAVDIALDVHKALGGPGFAEKIYHRAYCLELDARRVPFVTEHPILVRYKQWTIPGQKVDLLLGGVLIVELKVVPKVKRIHRLQVLSYLRTLDLRLGLILNFGAPIMKEGTHRVIN